MEIKAQLNKPYTIGQRVEFVEENQNSKDYEIRETEVALEAWGLTEEEKAKAEEKARKDNRIAELKQYLYDTDYIANKMIEAVDDAELQDLKEKYADTLKKRREARAEINQLEK